MNQLVANGAESFLARFRGLRDRLPGESAVRDTRDEPKTRAALRWRGKGRGNFLAANSFGRGTDDVMVIDGTAGVKLGENLLE